MTNAMIKNRNPPINMDITPKPSTINPPIAIPIAIPPFKTLKNIPFASSGLLGSNDVSIYWIRLYPIPSRIPKININAKTAIK